MALSPRTDGTPAGARGHADLRAAGRGLACAFQRGCFGFPAWVQTRTLLCGGTPPGTANSEHPRAG